MIHCVRTMSRSIGAAAIACLLTLAGSSATAWAGYGPGGQWCDDDPVMSPDEVQAATGKSIEEWGAAWWQWAFDNPDVLGDTPGEFGPLGDVGGPVFFAEGSNGGPVKLNYSVPAGRYLLVPVATYLWTFFDPCAETHCARRIINRNFVDNASDVYARIDGVPVRHLASHSVRVDRFNPPVFTVDAGPVDADGYGGILPAVQGGYWLMLRPLAPGVHRVNFGATVPALDPITGQPSGDTFRLDAQLTLKAVGCEKHKRCHESLEGCRFAPATLDPYEVCPGR